MKKRIVSLLLAAAMLVLLAVPAFAEDGHAYTYVALGDSITAGIGLPDAVYQKNGSFYDVSGNYHGYSGDCYVAKVADALGLDRDHAINYGMPALMSNNLLELVQTGATHSDNADYTLPGLREELQTADLITVQIGSNDVLMPLMGAVAAATGGKAFKLLLPMLEGNFREINADSLNTLREGLQALDLTAEERKATLRLLDSGIAELCSQSRTSTLANIEATVQELQALNPNAQIILLGYYNPVPLMPTLINPFVDHFRTLNRALQELAGRYGVTYVSTTCTAVANDAHPTACGHKYLARQILKALEK